jgi:hypothetical protein
MSWIQIAPINEREPAFRYVTIARDNGAFVEIASGLSAGDQVALNISNQIANGDRVTVRADTKAAAAQ